MGIAISKTVDTPIFFGNKCITLVTGAFLMNALYEIFNVTISAKHSEFFE